MQKIMIAGCLGQDARVSEPRENRVAINFSVAANSKRGDQEVATWYSCVYWKDADKAKVAEYLTKGTGVIVDGVPSVDVWRKKDTGEPQAAIVVNVRSLEFMTGTHKVEITPIPPEMPESKAENTPTADDDLPF